jgi:Protein of unknown function (DUF2946)
MTAWLGLVAMWLVVCAPLVSQLVFASRAHEPVASLCSAVAPLHHERASGLLAECGYCDLLATHAAMPSMPPVAVQILALIAVMVAPVLSVHFVPLGTFPSGRSRAPPFVS